MKKTVKIKKTFIFVCAALVITIILGTASVLAANAIIESKSVGVDKALAIALEEKGLDGVSVDDVSVKLHVRDGVAVYVVRLDCESVKYTVIINAESGEVIESTEKECVKPEKPTKPEKPEKPAETEPTESPEDGETAPEENAKPEFGKHHGKGQGKGHGKGHGKMPQRKGHGGNNKAPTAPEETTAPEVTA